MRGSVWIEKRTLASSKKHPNGRSRYYVTSEVDGTKRSHGGFDTLRDAQARKRLLLSQIADATFGKAEKRNPLNDYDICSGRYHMWHQSHGRETPDVVVS
jgi:hypothetical protein